MITGTIKWFDPSKGYGFIIPTESGGDIFLLPEDALASGIEFIQGMEIAFEPFSTESGNIAARNIKPA